MIHDNVDKGQGGSIKSTPSNWTVVWTGGTGNPVTGVEHKFIGLKCMKQISIQRVSTLMVFMQEGLCSWRHATLVYKMVLLISLV